MKSRLSGILFHKDNPAISRVEPHLIKHTPGKRAVVLYYLFDDSKPGGPQSYIAKIYRKTRGADVFKNMRAISKAAGKSSGLSFSMPEPIEYLPQLGMVLQSFVSGNILSGIAENEVYDHLEAVAENLAGLHSLSMNSGQQREMKDHIMKYCHPGPEYLKRDFPEFAAAIDTILKRMDDIDRLNAPVTPVHGDLGLEQIILKNNRAYFIDFDGFCHSHPALDLGNFSVVLETHFPRYADIFRERFIEVYLRGQKPEMLRGLFVFRAFAYLRRAMIAYRKEKATHKKRVIRKLLNKAITNL